MKLTNNQFIKYRNKTEGMVFKARYKAYNLLTMKY